MGILMYADDLVLISALVLKLLKMVDLCLNVLTSLDLKVNVKKSACIRIGRDFKHDCTQLTADGTLIPWVPCFTYLGVALISETKFSLDFKPARIKFYRSFNSLYCKISKASEVLIASLENTFCVPAMMFGFEAFSLNASNVRAIDKPIYNAMGKIFKTFDHTILDSCMYFLNVLPPRLAYLKNRINFLLKMNKTENDVVIGLFDLFGKLELKTICNSHNLPIAYCTRKCMLSLISNNSNN